MPNYQNVEVMQYSYIAKRRNQSFTTMKLDETYIRISSQTAFVPQQSNAEENRFVFTYTITISNQSEDIYQLLSRHWVIQDANMKIEEVYGEGVIGEQPIIRPGESYTYSSGAVLETDLGTMEGRYFFRKEGEESDSEYEASIPKFLLSIPRTIH